MLLNVCSLVNSTSIRSVVIFLQCPFENFYDTNDDDDSECYESHMYQVKTTAFLQCLSKFTVESLKIFGVSS